MKSILLIGTNRLGSLLVREFHKLGHQVMAVDKNEARINSVLPFVTDAQIGDSTNAAFLRSLPELFGDHVPAEGAGGQAGGGPGGQGGPGQVPPA